MKIVDPTIETVLCGSSLNSMDTFPEWEATVLDDAYEYADYISLHQYFGGQEKGTEQFLAQADELDEYICTVKSVIRYIKAKKKTEKPVNISFDEWGVWTHASSDTVKQTDEKRWETAPAISEMIYSFEDSLLFAEMLMAFIRNADSVKIACQALIANISSMIITEKGGGLWYQPTYYQFSAMSKYGKGIILDSRNDEKDGILNSVTVFNDQTDEIVFFTINRSANEDIELNVEFQGFRPVEIIEHQIMHSKDIKANNSISHNNVRPEQCDNSTIVKNRLISSIPFLSWNVIRIKVMPG